MPTKEELAAELRGLLGVKVKFEKLTKQELEQVLAALKKLGEAAEPERTPSDGPLGLGILPAFVEAAKRRVPEIRARARKLAESMIDDFLSALEEGERK